MPEVSLTLFIAGGTVNSSRAEQNLKQALAMVEAPATKLDVIDLLEDPSRAASEGILVTPTLLCRIDGRTETMIGTLEDTDNLQQQLRSWLRAGADPAR